MNAEMTEREVDSEIGRLARDYAYTEACSRRRAHEKL